MVVRIVKDGETSLTHPARGECLLNSPRLKKRTGKVTAAGFSEITRHAIRVPYQELDDAVGLTEIAGAVLTDTRRGKNGHL